MNTLHLLLADLESWQCGAIWLSRLSLARLVRYKNISFGGKCNVWLQHDYNMAILHSEVPTEWLTQFETQKTERKSNSIMHLDGNIHDFMYATHPKCGLLLESFTNLMSSLGQQPTKGNRSNHLPRDCDQFANFPCRFHQLSIPGPIRRPGATKWINIYIGSASLTPP